MRKFYLQNSIGVRKDLQLKSFFFNSPKGLGLSNKANYEQLGDGFYANSFLEAEQINIVGEIAFLESAYDDFQDLIDWIYSGYDLSFIYAPDGSTEYYCDIDIDYIEKEEIDNETGCLHCPVSFLGKTAWYKTTPTILNFTIDPDADYMKFDFITESRFPRGNSYNAIDVSTSGHYPAYIKLTIDGAISNPVISLVNNVTGAIIGKVDLTGTTVESGEILMYSSVPENSYIKILSADGAYTDLVDSIDLSYDNFFGVPFNASCSLKLEFTGSPTEATIYLYNYWRSV